jgi:hypothetical protein
MKPASAVDAALAVRPSSGDEWDVSGRPKTSQDVVEASLQRLVSSTDMGFSSGTDTWIGDGALTATPTGGEATRPPVERYVTGRLLRVRAFMRVTRRAKGSTCCQSVGSGRSPRLTRHGGRRESVALWSEAGGPSPLTEDRQKPRCLRDGMHGTRNTVPSRAQRLSLAKGDRFV